MSDLVLNSSETRPSDLSTPLVCLQVVFSSPEMSVFLRVVCVFGFVLELNSGTLRRLKYSCSSSKGYGSQTMKHAYGSIDGK